MGYPYILLLGASTSPPLDSDVYAKRGLHERGSQGPIRLFTSPQTPTLWTACGGVIVGHLFLRNGTLLDSPSQLQPGLAPNELRKFLLEQCWGEYILIQQEQDSSGTVIVTRDPSGGVPCIYSVAGDADFITSDITLAISLGLYKKQINWDFVAHHLTYPYLKTERTGLSGVQELLPGCVLRWRARCVSVDLAWTPWTFVNPTERHSNPYAATMCVRDAIETVVSSLSSVDGSILVELSGGLDSSVVGACLRNTRSRVECVTLAPAVPGADERCYAAAVAGDLGAALHVEGLRIEDARIDAPPPSWALAPGVAPLQYAVDQIMMAVADREKLATFYSGGGGDTVFCYLHNASPAADAFKALGIGGCARAIRNISELYQCTLWKSIGLTLKKLTREPRPPVRADHALISAEACVDFFDPHPWFKTPSDALPGDRERIFDLAGTQLLKAGLTRAMEHHFRLPLLSQPVVEACLRAPSWMWIESGSNRSIARAAFSDTLPANVVNRKSKGSFTQYCGAVYQRNKSHIRDFLLGGELHARRLIDHEALSALLARPPSPRDESFMRTFRLCTVESWVRHQG